MKERKHTDGEKKYSFVDTGRIFEHEGEVTAIKVWGGKFKGKRPLVVFIVEEINKEQCKYRVMDKVTVKVKTGEQTVS